MKDKIFITSIDRDRIKKTLDDITRGGVSPSKTVKGLESELRRAVIVDPMGISSDVITMNSRAIIELNGEEETEVLLVYPQDADPANKKLSILSPIGMALIGCKEGSVIECNVPSGKTKIHIKKVVYQPESAGDYHL
ncbi:MAG: GreA/GreB family elongation factor [Eubacteriales bacterium]|nr:transcription elongation factor GreAB [Clostridiales bacterium]